MSDFAVESLSRLLSLHDNQARLPEMGLRGQPLAAAYSADAWAERWVYVFRNLCP